MTWASLVDTPNVIVSGLQRSAKWSLVRLKFVNTPPPALAGKVAVVMMPVEAATAVCVCSSGPGVAVTTMIQGVQVGGGVRVGSALVGGQVGITETTTVCMTTFGVSVGLNVAGAIGVRTAHPVTRNATTKREAVLMLAFRVAMGLSARRGEAQATPSRQILAEKEGVSPVRRVDCTLGRLASARCVHI